MASPSKTVCAFRAAMATGNLPEGAPVTAIESPAELRHIARLIGVEWDSTVAYLMPIFLSLMLLAWRLNRSPLPPNANSQLAHLMDRACSGDATDLIEYAKRHQAPADLVTWRWFAENAIGFPIVPLIHMWPLVTRERFQRRKKFNAACLKLWCGNPLHIHRFLVLQRLDDEERQVLGNVLSLLSFNGEPSDELSHKGEIERFFAEHTKDPQSGCDVFEGWFPFKRERGERDDARLQAVDHGLLPNEIRKAKRKQKNWKVRLARQAAKRKLKHTPL